MARQRRSKKTKSAKVPTTVKHEVSVTLTRYVPPLRPRPREQAFKVRRVLQRSVVCVQDSSDPTQANFSVTPSMFFNASYSTTGFEALFVHRVAIWTGIVVPGTGQTVFAGLRAYFNDLNGVSLYPDFKASAGAYNERARVGFYVPSHLSGPFKSNSTKDMINGQVYNESSQGNFPVHTILCEIDATFC